MPVVLALSALLLGGCRSVPAPAARAAADDASGTNSIALTEDRLAGQTTSEKLARAHAHYMAGLLHGFNNESDEALSEFYRAALYDPGDQELMLDVTRQLLLSKQPQKALDLLLLATARPDATGEIYARLGLVYFQLGRNDKALEANRIAVRKSPLALAAYHNLFLGRLQAGQSAEALKVLDEAARQPGADATFLAGVADLYVNFTLQFPSQRDAVRDRLLAVLDRALGLKPTDPQLRLKLADDYSMFGSQDKALALYRQLVDEFADLPALRDTVRLKLVEIYFAAFKYKEAIEQLQGIIQDDPSNAQAYYYLGGIAYDQQRWTDAVDNLQKAILFAPGLEQAYYNLAGAQLALNRPEDALGTLTKLREHFPQKFALEYMTGMAQERLKNYPAATGNFTAAEVLAQAGETNRLTPEFYFEFGAALERNGDYAQSEKYFNKCLQLAPDFAEGLNYLGFMWADHGTNLDQARVMIEKAVKLEPKNPAFLDSMGWVLFKLNQPGPALDYVLKAVALSEERDETLYDHLGDIYAALKQMDKAREFWAKSLEVQPDDNIRKKLQAAGGAPAAPRTTN